MSDHIVSTTKTEPTDKERRFQEFVARFNADMAERFKDWPKGCIVRGPSVDLPEIDSVVCCIGADPEART